ncbi:MAG: TM0106 family RecB-like putative nuclease [Chryseoglobus sp.]|nr:TM0106 family RecB-like putative nuclease [Microcella sp.]MBX9471055.1 TM0106 family RecB-like putative nuclease [Microcella sp.]
MLVTSASDLTRAAECEFRVARDLDARLGRLAAVDDEPDAMLARTAELGDAHEAAIIADYRARAAHPDDVLEIDRADSAGLDAIEPLAAQTLDALRRGVPVIVQATFVDRDHSPGQPGDLPIAFVGYADFLVRTAEGAYRVQDSKLARRAKVTALLQLAAYAEQLERLGIAVDPEVDLILGTREVSIHRLDDIAPVLRARRARLHRLLRERAAATGPIAWRDPSVTYCRSCAWCTAEIAQHDDVSQVAGLTGAQWTKLGAAGIETLEQLAALDDRAAVATASLSGISRSTLDALRLQAELQRQAAGATAGTPPPVRVRDAAVLHALPAPNPGDLYFDFEGDPLYTEHDPTQWGLDYLFGFVDAEGAFTAYWAHSFADERDALIAFLADVKARRAQHPDLHIYHYAAYERTHLRSLAARHAVGEDVIDEWLRTGVLVDLYPVVRKALRVGSPSYSIKYLEPIYWPEAREGAAVARGDDSVAEYVRARALREAGDSDPASAAAAQQILDDIGDYNEVDCLSTLKLAAWLRELAAEHPSPPPVLFDDEPAPRELPDSPLRTALLELAANDDGTPSSEPDRTPEQRAYAYAAAAIDYHRREHKTFWWDHFDRLVAPLDEWADVRDVLTVDSDQHRADAHHEQSDWIKPTPRSSLGRTVRLRGAWSAGSRPTVGGRSGPFALYEQPAPFAPSSRDPGARSARAITLVELHDDGVTYRETLAKGVEPYTDLPVALTPASPPPAGQQKPAIEEWGSALVQGAASSKGAEWPAEPVGDLLRRVSPRTRSAKPLAEVPIVDGEPDRVSAVIASLLDLDRSYLAVQGPPGTGKTYLGAHVIAALVQRQGWRIGVVAQGHATVEHMLEGVVAAGLPSRQVAKAPRTNADPVDYATAHFTVLGEADDLYDYAHGQPDGFVIGGTAWDFSNPQRVARRSLDLLVIDEAGQFSLAATIAASMAAKNLLLLGDPQQLPQVSQGTHPEPIDGSALGYLSAGHDVLPAELGYFLAETRRLHPALAEPVSRLSYEGQLHAHPSAAERELVGVAPGLHPVPVQHHGNATESVEEADEVVAIIRRLIGSEWTSGPDAEPRPLADRDVIVVTPYNAQQQTIREGLDAAGFTSTRVGTVDKFQGQEAAVAIVSLAASSSRDAPRGMEFLLNRNRLNVAISRAQWAAYLVHSPGLLDSLPHTPQGVAELSAFIRLVETH